MPDITGNTNAATFSSTGGISRTITNRDAVASNIGQGINGVGPTRVFGTNPNTLASSWRANGIPEGAQPNYDLITVSAQFSEPAPSKDWRVRISCDLIYGKNDFLWPLEQTGGMIFPYLPEIQISHTANYQQMDITHINYPFYAYKNSQADEISINGKFTVQNANDAQYWLASVHFLRSVTKMFFGQGENLGNPPPICTLNGYGDYVFNNVPCVIKSFNVNLPPDVDYIECNAGDYTSVSGQQDAELGGPNVTYVPVFSQIVVNLQPIYSREKIKSFDLKAFANGQMVLGSGNKGFI